MLRQKVYVILLGWGRSAPSTPLSNPERTTALQREAHLFPEMLLIIELPTKFPGRRDSHTLLRCYDHTPSTKVRHTR